MPVIVSAGAQVRYSGGELRERMPTITAWLDDLRSAFGAEMINAAIKGGIAGQPTFWAEENGIVVGTPRLMPHGTISVDGYLRLLDLERLP